MISSFHIPHRRRSGFDLKAYGFAILVTLGLASLAFAGPIPPAQGPIPLEGVGAEVASARSILKFDLEYDPDITSSDIKLIYDFFQLADLNVVLPSVQNDPKTTITPQKTGEGTVVCYLKLHEKSERILEAEMRTVKESFRPSGGEMHGVLVRSGEDKLNGKIHKYGEPDHVYFQIDKGVVVLDELDRFLGAGGIF
ncbi:hypothetical protein C8R42DRAFT_727824 [Lentinula raphanica]|nr:hypothetical protein C8R42DRAFT_727824 [Lentinula raphanica]